MHLQNGSIQDHFLESHQRKITRTEIVDSTHIRYIEHDPIRLKLLEALVIHFENPGLNHQDTGQKRILMLYS